MAQKEGGAGKNRGATGVANAAAHAFRLNGLAPDWMARRAGAYKAPRAIESRGRFNRLLDIGTHKVRGAIGGILAMRRFGFGFEPSLRLEALVEGSLDRSPVAAAAFDRIGNEPKRKKAARKRRVTAAIAAAAAA